MSEKLLDCDVRNATVGEPRLELGQPAAHRISKAHAAVLDQPERRRRDDRLGDRREQEDAVLLHRTASLPVGETSCSAVDDVTSFSDQDDGSHDAPVFQRPLDGPVEPGSQTYIAVVAAKVRRWLVGARHIHRLVALVTVTVHLQDHPSRHAFPIQPPMRLGGLS